MIELRPLDSSGFYFMANSKRENALKIRRYKVDINYNCGIYFLFRHGIVVYVGQSIDVPVRISQHKVSGGKDFDEYSFIRIPKDKLDSTERYYINFHNPTYNKTKGNNPSKIRHIDSRYGITDREPPYKPYDHSNRSRRIPSVKNKGKLTSPTELLKNR